MTATIARRLEALEQAHPQVQPLLMLVRFISPTGAARELHAVREMRGPSQWERAPDETEREFIGRAEREAPRNPLGVAVLVEVRVG